jgi:predicted site-specific integrase-resolvase
MTDIAAIRERKLVFYASLSSDISLEKQKNSLISRINRVHKTDRQAK